VALSQELEKATAPGASPTINKRIPRKAYYVIREFWKHPVTKKTHARR